MCPGAKLQVQRSEVPIIQESKTGQIFFCGAVLGREKVAQVSFSEALECAITFLWGMWDLLVVDRNIVELIWSGVRSGSCYLMET